MSDLEYRGQIKTTLHVQKKIENRKDARFDVNGRLR